MQVYILIYVNINSLHIKILKVVLKTLKTKPFEFEIKVIFVYYFNVVTLIRYILAVY